MSIIKKEHFNELIQDPSILHPEVIPQLEETISKFPFCHISHALLAKASAMYDTNRLDQHRPKAAAYALSRTALQNLIESSTERLPSPSTEDSQSVDMMDMAQFIEQEAPVLAVASADEKNLNWQKSEEQERQKLIIEGFMKKNPRIPRQENDLKPVSLDLKGRLAESGTGGIDTEAFAKILLKQGKIDKAKDVYQKLILKNPEKRNYFAKKLGELNRLT